MFLVIEVVHFCILHVDMKPASSPSQLEPDDSHPVIKEAIRECVDEDHSVVTSLVKADYSLEESIEAVVKCGTLEDALQYLEMAALGEKDSSNEISMNQSWREPIQETNNEVARYVFIECLCLSYAH